jgi:S-adenosylmethionine decarboxylase
MSVATICNFDQDNNKEAGYRDLAPEIHRQRMVIEGYPKGSISDSDIKEYLEKLSSVLGMDKLCDAVTHQSPKYGWAGWIHWETSGAHFYAWDEPLLFFSVDIYTCKAFCYESAKKFTADFFGADDVVYKAF